MVRKNKASRNTGKISNSLESQKLPAENIQVKTASDFLPKRSLFTLRNIIIVLVLVLAVLAWKFKGYFIAATVNGQPISRWELNDLLVKRFGQQTLDNIVSERLVLAAVRQKGIFITNSEIDGKVKEIEEKLKGQASLTDALSAQGLTVPMFRRQLEIQISIEKLFDNEATISSQEIDNYYSQSSTVYKNATDPASVKEEVKSTLKQQKINNLFEKWFAEIRKNAKVTKFL